MKKETDDEKKIRERKELEKQRRMNAVFRFIFSRKIF